MYYMLYDEDTKGVYKDGFDKEKLIEEAMEEKCVSLEEDGYNGLYEWSVSLISEDDDGNEWFEDMVLKVYCEGSGRSHFEEHNVWYKGGVL